MKHLNENERKVLEFLADQCDVTYWGFDGIKQHINLDRKIIRRACRSLARKGLAEFRRGLWNDAGYGVTKAGLEAVKR